MDEFETKKALYGRLKQFAKAEMARDLGTRHGRSIKLPWDPESHVEPSEESGEFKLDSEALSELASRLG